jgi:SSS family solute:Na+ symporter
VVIGFLAAMISTLSSILNSAQTLVTMDMIAKVKPGWQGRRLVVAGNVAGLVVIVIAALWAPQIQHFDSVVKYFQQLLSYMAPPVVAVFLCGLFWKRASATGAFTALLSGFVVALVLLKFIGLTPLGSWHFLYVAPVLFVLSLAILAGVSLVTEPPSAAAVDRYVWRPAIFREESAELAGRPWFSNYRILSLILLLITLTFFLIWK